MEGTTGRKSGVMSQSMVSDRHPVIGMTEITESEFASGVQEHVKDDALKIKWQIGTALFDTKYNSPFI